MKGNYERIFSIIIGAVSIVLILYWYDWKLLLILILFGWANNLMISYQIK